MGTLELIRRLIRQETNLIGEVVTTLYGPAAASEAGLAQPNVSRWLKATIPGSSLIDREEFYAVFRTTEPRDVSTLTAVDGVVATVESRPAVVLLRAGVTVPRKQSYPLTIDVGSGSSEFAVYVDGVLARRGSSSIVHPLTLSAGKHSIEVFAVSTVLAVSLPASLTVDGSSDAPAAPLWESLVPGYVDASIGSVSNQLTWWADPSAGGWKVLRREFEFLDAITAISAITADGRMTVTIAGDWTAAVQVGEQLNALTELLGTVVAVRSQGADMSDPELLEADIHSTETIVTVALDASHTAVKPHWFDATATVGSFSEVASITRAVASGRVVWHDTAIVLGRGYEYALVGVGTFDPNARSPKSEARYLRAGDADAPGSIVPEPDYPDVTNKTVTVRFRTPTDEDYAGVNVYFREEIAGVIASVTEEQLVLTLPVMATRGVDAKWFVRITNDLDGEVTGAVRAVASATDDTVTFAPGAPFGTLPAEGSSVIVFKLHPIVTDHGFPNRIDELSFDPTAHGDGWYIFRTFDLSNNEQPEIEGFAWQYDAATMDQYIGGGATSGHIKPTVANDLADLAVRVDAPSYLFPIDAVVYEDVPDDPAHVVATLAFTAPAQVIDKTTVPALGARTLPSRELRRWWVKFTDAFGNITWAYSAADRDSLPVGSVSIDDFTDKPTIYCYVDDDTDIVRFVTPAGLIYTWAVQEGDNVAWYRRADTVLDPIDGNPTPQETALGIDTTTGEYIVEVQGGGITKRVWQGVLHGKSSKAPATQVRTELIEPNRDSSNVYVTVSSPVAESMTVRFRDSESDGAPMWFLVTSNTDSTIRYVPTNSVIGPESWFWNGTIFRQILGAIPLVRDQVRRVFVQAVASSGGVSSWDTIGLSATEKPWLESIDLTWDEAAGQFTLRAVPGAFCQSARFVIDTTENPVAGTEAFVAEVLFSEAGTPNGVSAVFTPTGSFRDRIWHGRVTPFNGVLDGAGHVQGLAGQPQRDSTFVPLPNVDANQPPVVGIRQLTLAEQALFPDLRPLDGDGQPTLGGNNYKDTTRWVILRLDARDPIDGYAGVVIHYRRKTDAERTLPAITAPLTSGGQPNNNYPVDNVAGGQEAAGPYIVDDPTGAEHDGVPTRSRYVALERAGGQNFIEVWAYDVNGTGLRSATQTYRVDFNELPEVASIDVRLDENKAHSGMGVDGVVTVQVTVDDDTRSFRYWLDGAEHLGTYNEPTADTTPIGSYTPPGPAFVRDTAISGSSILLPIQLALGVGTTKTLKIQCFTGPNATGTAGEIFERVLSRPPRSDVKFEDKDRSGRTSATWVKAALSISPQVLQVYPTDGTLGVIATVGGRRLTATAPGWTADQWLYNEGARTTYFVEIAMTRTDSEGVARTRRIAREIDSNGPDWIDSDTHWPSSDPEGFVPQAGDKFRVVDAAVYARVGTRTADGVEDWGLGWEPVVPPQPKFFERGDGRLLEYYAIRNGCPAEPPKQTFHDADNDPTIANVAIGRDGAKMTVTISGLDDDVKSWRAYACKAPNGPDDPATELWPTIDRKKGGVPDEKYLRANKDASERSYSHNAGNGWWYVIIVPYNSFGDRGDPQFWPRQKIEFTETTAASPALTNLRAVPYTGSDAGAFTYNQVLWDHLNIAEYDSAHPEEFNTTVEVYLRCPALGIGSASTYESQMGAYPHYAQYEMDAVGPATNMPDGKGSYLFRIKNDSPRGSAAAGDTGYQMEYLVKLLKAGVVINTYTFSQIEYYGQPVPRLGGLNFSITRGTAQTRGATWNCPGDAP